MNRLLVIYNADDDQQNPEAPHLVWRRIEDGNWLGPPEQGSLQELATAQNNSHSEVWLALSSTEIVMVQSSFDAKEKRHLAKLMPYELEEDILGDVDEFHFAYGAIHGDQVTVAYTPKQWLITLLEQFEQAGLEVSVCTPLPLLLPFEENQWSLRWLGEGKPVEVRYSHDLAFTVPLVLLQDALLSLGSSLEEDQHPQQIKLLGQSFEDLQTLQENLPENLQEKATSAQWDEWLSLSMELIPALNMRQQSLGRQLPIARWWQTWRPAAIVAGVAIVAYLASNYVALAQLKAEHKAHLAASEKAYRAVVPQGTIVDPERQLKTQLAKFKSSDDDQSGGAVPLLAKVNPTLAKNDNIEVRSLNFTAGEIRLNVESEDFRQIEEMRSELGDQRLVAELLGTSKTANGTQARLKIRSVQ